MTTGTSRTVHLGRSNTYGPPAPLAVSGLRRKPASGTRQVTEPLNHVPLSQSCLVNTAPADFAGWNPPLGVVVPYHWFDEFRKNFQHLKWIPLVKDHCGRLSTITSHLVRRRSPEEVCAAPAAAVAVRTLGRRPMNGPLRRLVTIGNRSRARYRKPARISATVR